MDSKPRLKKNKSLDELLEDNKIKKEALEKILKKINTNSNHKTE